MESKKVTEYLIALSKHLHYYNVLSPFPVFDTEYIRDLDDKIREIKSNKLKDYDKEPVVACKHCNSLHIVVDDIDNNVCFRCGSVNDLRDFKNIYEYSEYTKKRKNE